MTSSSPPSPPRSITSTGATSSAAAAGGPRAASRGTAEDASEARPWTVLELLRWTTQHFASREIESARLDAECLLAFALGRSRLELYLDFEKPVEADARSRFRELVRQRGSQRIPVSQLVGRKEFWSLSLKVSCDVLTPRPETESLVAAALAALPEHHRAYRVLDLGTGSGAVALAIASERPAAQITATDISYAALQIAAANADELRLRDRIGLLQGRLFAPLRPASFDLVVSNPPYLARSVSAGLAPELAYEPEEALFGGDDGLAVLRPLVAQVSEVLRPGGVVAVEIDPGQAECVTAWCGQAGLEGMEIGQDLARRPRVVVARRPESNFGSAECVRRRPAVGQGRE